MLTLSPVTPERWQDLADLFGHRGACGGCWCMWYRLTKKAYESGKGQVNRDRLRRLVMRRPPGILGYDKNVPVGWCSVAPREEYCRLESSRALRRIDEKPVWSIMCLFVHPSHRRRGISVNLIQAATAYAIAQGAPAVEAYPIVPRRHDVPPLFASFGVLSEYLKVGYVVVRRPSPSRAVVRHLGEHS